MCGISGFIVADETLAQMLAQGLLRSLAHRGPDDEGVELLRPDRGQGRVLGLVHRRLAIIDLSRAAHQPMFDPDTGNWISYNGEIYNHSEFRQQLLTAGTSFRSRSDTEVILKGYAREGVRVLDRLCGMFALSLWDARREELLLAVDPVGIKPLYYWRGPDGTFLFASELRALMETGLVARLIDAAGLESYLSYGAVQAPATIVRGVHALLPGSFLRVGGDGSFEAPRRYWTPPFTTEPGTGGSDGALADELRGLLSLVVKQHVVADVPVGVFLSGGVDSSSIAALMHETAPAALHTFSVTFPDLAYSEATYSREIARRYSAEHTEIQLSEADLLASLPAALRALDQPTVDGTNVFVISRAVRDAGVAVALSGQGADELFGGYPTFRYSAFIDRWGAWFDVARALSGVFSKLTGMNHALIPHKGRQLIVNGHCGFGAYLILRQLFPPSTRRALFPHGSLECTAEGLPVAVAHELRSRASPLDPVDRVSYLELNTYLANMLLRDGDVMSMAHSLEVRVPFLDRRLVELVARIPGRMKMNSDVPKFLLVRALGGCLPAAIYRRPKQGFTFPWECWLRQQLKPVVESALMNGQAFERIGVDRSTVQRLWMAFQRRTGRVTWSRIWALFVLHEWAERQTVRF